MNMIVECTYAIVDPDFFKLSVRVIPEIKVRKLHCLIEAIILEPKLGVLITNIRIKVLFMIRFNDRFGTLLLHPLKVIIDKQLAMVVFVPIPADQLSLLKICYGSPITLCIFDAPFFMGFQIN